MLTKTTIENANKFCKDDIKEIEGYNEAITSDKKYCCHHKNGINISKEELIEKGLYYNRPACEFIFLSISDHNILHKQNLREETKRKMSGAHKGEKNGFYGKKHTEESKKKISDSNKNKKECIINGTTYGCIKDAYEDIKPNYTYKTFCWKYKEGKL